MAGQEIAALGPKCAHILFFLFSSSNDEHLPHYTEFSAPVPYANSNRISTREKKQQGPDCRRPRDRCKGQSRKPNINITCAHLKKENARLSQCTVSETHSRKREVIRVPIVGTYMKKVKKKKGCLNICPSVSLSLSVRLVSLRFLMDKSIIKEAKKC